MTRRSAEIVFCGLLMAAGLGATEIPAGTHVLLRMMNSVTTKTAQTGDYVYLRTASPIVTDGRIVVPAGSYVQGVVSRAKRSGRISGRAELGIRLETITLPRGRTFRFAPRLSSVDAGDSEQKVDRRENAIEQAPQHGHDVAQVAIYAGSGAALGGLADRSWKGAGIGGGIGSAVGLASVLATRGREVVLRQGMTVDVAFDRPVLIQ